MTMHIYIYIYVYAFLVHICVLCRQVVTLRYKSGDPLVVDPSCFSPFKAPTSAVT